MNSAQRKRLMTRYLLGDASDKERAALEKGYFRKRDALAELLSVENDLIDAFVRGDLTVEEADKFRDRYINSAKRREKVEFARLLTKYAPPVKREPKVATQRKRALDWQNILVFLRNGSSSSGILAGGLALGIIGATFLIGVATRQRHNIDPTAQQGATTGVDPSRPSSQSSIPKPVASTEGISSPTSLTSRNPKGAGPAQALRSGPPLGRLTPTIVSLILMPNHTRGAEAQAASLILSTTAKSVSIALSLDKVKYERYSASLKRVAGDPVCEQSDLRVQLDRHGLPAIIFRIPAKLLQEGDYVVKLSGVADTGEINDAGGYVFTVR
ncbi:MAG TPA: hypothetical protein VKZ53_08270 [Candidatus Angelobacter sp.]|nr:hypothetical protein [Candidatus Angelobacter sp.]